MTAREVVPTSYTSPNQAMSPSTSTRALLRPHLETPPICMLAISRSVRVQPLEQLSSTLLYIYILQIVFNPTTYPKFLRFLAPHKRTTDVIKTQMTSSVSRHGGALEWVAMLCTSTVHVVDEKGRLVHRGVHAEGKPFVTVHG